MNWSIPAKAHRAVTIAALVVVVGVVSTGAVVLTAGEIPRGTTVLGVDIGGSSESEAQTTLRKALGDRLTAPVKMEISGKEISADPTEMGLSLDVSATVRRAKNQIVNPWSVVFGERAIEPVVRVDIKKLDDAVTPQAAEIGTPMRMPSIRFNKDDGDLTPVASYGKAGTGFDAKASAGLIRDGWLRAGRIAVPLSTIKPAHDKAAVDELVRTVALPAISSDVVVHTAAGDVTITPNQIAAGLLLDGDERGAITPRIDAALLREALGEKLSGFGTPAKDAVFSVKSDHVVVEPAQPGSGLDVEKLAGPLLKILKEPAPRSVEGEMGPLEPKLTTEKANALGVKEKISSFTTKFNGGQDRNKNIILVADEVDGALVMPGEEFSLNGYTGERGPNQGYVKAPVILGGKIKNEYGGGISQFATTLYNAVFFSGLEDVFHKAHGYYISRYPAGREATVYYPSLDLKFRNDSSYGVLIDASYTDTSITVTFWSTKRYEIESESGERTNPREIKTTYLEEEDCVATEGIPGFDIVVYRIFKQDGREIKRERIFTSYKAEPKFICGKDPNAGG